MHQKQYFTFSSTVSHTDMSAQLSNNGSNSDDSVGESPLSETLRYVTAALLTFTCVLGLTGYSVMIVVIWKTQNLGGALHVKLGGNDGGSRALLLNAYVAGLIGSGVVIPVYIANIFGGTLVVPLSMCKIFGFLNVLTFNALLSTSVAIAIRQCLLLSTKTYGRYSYWQTRVVIVVSWSVPMVMALIASPYVGFNANLLNCLFDSNADMPQWFPTIVISIPVLVVVATIFVCYVLLFQSTKIRQRSLQNTSEAPATSVAPAQSHQSMPPISTVTGETTQMADIRLKSLWTKASVRNTKLAVKLIANWLIFAAFWLPLAFMFLASVRSPVTPESWLVGSLLARLFYGMGWAVFGIWNERLRHTLKMLLLGARLVNRQQVRPTSERIEGPTVRKKTAATQTMQATDQQASLSFKSVDG